MPLSCKFDFSLIVLCWRFYRICIRLLMPFLNKSWSFATESVALNTARDLGGRFACGTYTFHPQKNSRLRTYVKFDRYHLWIQVLYDQQVLHGSCSFDQHSIGCPRRIYPHDVPLWLLQTNRFHSSCSPYRGESQYACFDYRARCESPSFDEGTGWYEEDGVNYWKRVGVSWIASDCVVLVCLISTNAGS